MSSGEADPWSEGMGIAALCVAIPFALLHALVGLRWCRYLVACHGFVSVSIICYALLINFLDRIQLSQHDVLFLSIGLGGVAAIVSLVFWRKCLVFCGAHVGVVLALQVISIPFVMDTDPDVFSPVKIYSATGGTMLLMIVLYFFYPQSVILLSSCAQGSLTLALALDVKIETGFSHRYWRVVAEGLHIDNIFAVNIYFTDFGDAEECYFLLAGAVMFAIIMIFVQAYGTASAYKLDVVDDTPDESDGPLPLLFTNRNDRNDNNNNYYNTEDTPLLAPPQSSTRRARDDLRINLNVNDDEEDFTDRRRTHRGQNIVL